MSAEDPRPPRLAQWLLRRVLPGDARGASILGDLLEEFYGDAGPDRRARWQYWRHALSIGTRYLFASPLTPTREDLPPPRRAPMGFGLLHEDVRYAIRALRRTPGFTIVALTTLALGIGASTAIFSLVYTVLLRPLPYASPERLVHITETGGPRKSPNGVSWINFGDWRTRATTFEDLAATLSDAVNVTGDHPQRLNSRTSSWNFLRVLGVQPAAGRVFSEADARPDAPPVVVISHELWVRDYAASLSAIGQPLPIEHLPHTIIGVLPAGFVYRAPADVFRLVEPLAIKDFRGMTFRGNHTNLFVVGRLKAGATVAQAGAEMDTIAANLEREYPYTNASTGAQVLPLVDVIVARYRPTFLVLSGGVLLLLLIACVNLANLLLTRGTTRTHELSIRAALGGSRWRLVRQLLVEQVLLIALGALLGALTGRLLLMVLIALAPADVPRLTEVRLNDWLLLYTAAISGLSALAFGFIPALKASSVRGQELLVRSGRTPSLSTTHIRRGLMVAEVAVATILLAASGLMVQTMVKLAQVDPGFDASHLLTMNIEMMGDQWKDEAKRRVAYVQMIDRLRALPGVDSVAMALSLPVDGSRWASFFVTSENPNPPRDQVPFASFDPVSSGYFEAMKMHLVRGRFFDQSDTGGNRHTLVINESAANRLFPGQDPIGKRIMQGLPKDDHPWRTIVGVVNDVKMDGIDRNALPQFYVPIADEPAMRQFVVVMRGDRADQLTASASAALREFDKELPIYTVQTMDRLMMNTIGRQRVSMVVLTVFGAVALLLAVIGLYGVITYGVTERTQEIGLRIALGATGGQVLSLFLRQGLTAAIAGIGVGTAVALGLTRWLETLLFGVTATDATTFAIVVAVLLLVATAACYLPARRAARVDPLIALRWE
jgi:putative ABC transport system permease protein